MTKFNPENKEELSYRETCEPAMNIMDQADALQYKKAYIDYLQKGFDDGRFTYEGKSAEEIVNANLGYYAGYYSDETRKRVERLFVCVHPVFGSIEVNGRPSSKEAFELGQEMAKKLK
jgi:hypothetical protein